MHRAGGPGWRARALSDRHLAGGDQGAACASWRAWTQASSAARFSGWASAAAAAQGDGGPAARRPARRGWPSSASDRAMDRHSRVRPGAAPRARCARRRGRSGARHPAPADGRIRARPGAPTGLGRGLRRDRRTASSGSPDGDPGASRTRGGLSRRPFPAEGGGGVALLVRIDPDYDYGGPLCSALIQDGHGGPPADRPQSGRSHAPIRSRRRSLRRRWATGPSWSAESSATARQRVSPRLRRLPVHWPGPPARAHLMSARAPGPAKRAGLGWRQAGTLPR